MAAITPGSSYDVRAVQSGLILDAELARPLSAFEGDEDDPRVAFPALTRAGEKRGSQVVRRFHATNRTRIPRSVYRFGEEGSIANPYEDSLSMGYIQFDDAVENAIEEQNLVNWDLVGARLAEFGQNWGNYFERSKVNQLVGNTAANSLGEAGKYIESGCNIVTAFDEAHIYRVPQADGGANLTDADVGNDATSLMTSAVLDTLATRANSTAWYTFPIAKCKTPFGRDAYICLVHGTGYQQLLDNTDGNKIYDLMKAAIQGGVDLSGTCFDKAEGFFYNDTLVLKSDYLPNGLATSSTYDTNTRTFAWFGANAGGSVHGEKFATKDDSIGYKEHVLMRRLAMLTDTVWGFKRTIVTSTSYASIRGVHYSDV